MKSSKEYYMNLGLVWLFGPLITGFSLHMHPFFGVVMWWGIALVLIVMGFANGGTKDKDSPIKED